MKTILEYCEQISSIDEYLLSKNTPKTKKVVSDAVSDHENDEVNPDKYHSLIDFITWLKLALKEYGDLSDEEYEFFMPQTKHLNFYADGSIRFRKNENENENENEIIAKFKITDRKTTFKELYDKVLSFINENIDKMY